MIETSIIIPHFQRAEYLIETLCSIQRQTYQNWECIIVDDGSTPETIETIKSFIAADKRINLILRPVHLSKGANSCRQYGLKLANGKYIKWFDSDDIMETNFLEEQIKVIRSGYQGVLSKCDVYNGDFSQLLREGWREKYYSDKYFKEYFRGQLAWQTGAGLWDKQIFKEFQPFNNDLKNAQEWLFHLQLLTRGIKIAVIGKALFKIRTHENSISQTRHNQYAYHRFLSRIIALTIISSVKVKGKRYLLKSIIKGFVTNLGKVKLFEYLKIVNLVIYNVLKTILKTNKQKPSILELV